MSVDRKQVKWRYGGMGPAGNPRVSQTSFAPPVACMGKEDYEKDLSRNQKHKCPSKMGLLLIITQPVLSSRCVFANQVCEKGNTLALKPVFMRVAKHGNTLT